MSATGRRAIAARIRAIEEWRRERELQDMLGLGPEAAQRSRRSADGLGELAMLIDTLADDDVRVLALEQAAFSGDQFIPGASLLEELGRFRFHAADQELEGFLNNMVVWAERDRDEMGLWGGPQVSGDNPWGADWILSIDDEDDW